MASGIVSSFVELALETIPRPYTRDVIDRVARAIERNPEWLAMYNDAVAEKGRAAVNRQLGHSVLELTGMHNSGARREARSYLIDSYTELIG